MPRDLTEPSRFKNFRDRLLGEDEARAKNIVREKEGKSLRQVQNDFSEYNSRAAAFESVYFIVLKFIAHFVYRSQELGTMTAEQAERFQETIGQYFCAEGLVPEYRFKVTERAKKS